MHLYLIRHTAPTIPPGICYGQTDVPTRDEDMRQCAARLLQHLPALLPVYSSPLSRCLGLAQYLHPSPIVDQRLAELDFGTWEMQTWDAIPREQIDAWAADVVHYPPGGNETLFKMVERVMALIADLQAQSTDQAILVCHAGVIKILSAWRSGDTLISLAERVAQMEQRFEFGSCTETKIVE